MELRQLEYVVAVSDHGTFTRAAAAVHVSQPSLSHGVRTLENELGVELFLRLGRTIEVTSAGRQVIDAARRVVRNMADLAAAAAAVTALETGTLHLVCLPTLAADPLAELIGRFRTNHPGIAVHVHEPEDPTSVENFVRSGQAELGLTDITTGGHGLQRIDLFRQQIVAASPPGSLHDSPLTPQALAALPLIVTPPGPQPGDSSIAPSHGAATSRTSPSRSTTAKQSSRSSSPAQEPRSSRPAWPNRQHVKEP